MWDACGRPRWEFASASLQSDMKISLVLVLLTEVTPCWLGIIFGGLIAYNIPC